MGKRNVHYIDFDKQFKQSTVHTLASSKEQNLWKRQAVIRDTDLMFSCTVEFANKHAKVITAYTDFSLFQKVRDAATQMGRYLVR